MVAAKCTQCGANITIDDTKEAGICEFCGTAFITEKVINNYNTINNYHANVVNVYNSPTEDFEVKAGVLVKYHGSNDKITIPEIVKAIGEEAFKNCEGLESVCIPSSVKLIKDRAFLSCTSLSSIVIPESVGEIKDNVFSGCTSLVDVIFKNRATKVGSFAFSGCTKLKRVVLPSSIENISNHMFSLCSELEKITIPYGCREIHHAAFSCCKKLKKIELPESLLVIYDDAFGCCTSLRSITIPASVRTIYAKEKVSETQTQVFSTFSCFNCCESLREVTFKGNNTEIRGTSLFENCPSDIIVHAPEVWKSQNSKKLTNKVSNGCYIATCVYGSYDCPQVWILRRYRDDTLASTWRGRLFIHIYYAISPTLVKWFGKTNWFKTMWRGTLDRIVKKLGANGVENTPYKDKY